MAERQPLNTYQEELDLLNPQIKEKEGNLAQFDNPSSYLNLLKNVSSASYNANADTIAFRQKARSLLYGSKPIGYTPENFSMLSPDQQATLKNAGRAGLIAGIQGSQEAEAARGNRTSDLLAAEGARISDVRESLSSSLSRLTSRRDQVEGLKQQAQTDSRNFFFDLVKNYPDLVQTLSPEEQNSLFNGTANKQLMDKVGLYAKQADDRNRYQTIEKDGYIITYDPGTGEIIKKVDTGIRDQRSGGGAGDIGSTTQKLLSAASDKGFTVERRANDDGTTGIWFFQNGEPINKIDWENGVRNSGINIGYLDVFEEMGTTNPADIEELKQAGRLVETRAVGNDDEYINQQISLAKDQGATRGDIQAYIRSVGRNPKDFGY